MVRFAPLSAILFISACGSQATSGTEAQEPQPAAGQLSTADQMWHHFWDAAEARKAVIRGELDAVRAPMERLAAREYGDEIPGDWAPWIDDMRAQGQRGSKAETLRTAADAVAALGNTCAECHRAMKGGGDFEGDTAGYQDLERKGLQERMARHLWSAEELWLGLSGPHHPAWSRGAAALMNITVPRVVTLEGKQANPDSPPTGEGSLQDEARAPEASPPADQALSAEGADMDVALEEMRALGRRADAASIPKEKQAVYGEILFRCGSCHSHLGIKVQ